MRQRLEGTERSSRNPRPVLRYQYRNQLRFNLVVVRLCGLVTFAFKFSGAVT